MAVSVAVVEAGNVFLTLSISNFLTELMNDFVPAGPAENN